MSMHEYRALVVILLLVVLGLFATLVVVDDQHKKQTIECLGVSK